MAYLAGGCLSRIPVETAGFGAKLIGFLFEQACETHEDLGEGFF
jgi:hypothetical protein